MTWVRDGVSLPVNPADSFPVDGQVSIFSTLRPADHAAGSLRLNTVNGNWLHFLIFCGVLGLGLLLLRQPLARHGAALAALVIVLVLLGVFLPTLATQIIHGGLWLALLLTVLIWIFAGLLHLNRRPPLATPVGPVWPVAPYPSTAH